MKIKPYSKYKDSGFEWIGEVPEHWQVQRLKYQSSVNDDTLNENEDPDYEMAYIDIGNVDSINGITNREAFSFAEAPSRARRKVKNGDVIVSTVRTYLKAISPIIDPEPNLIVSTGFAVIRPRRELTSRYAAYVLRAPFFVDAVVANSTGVSYPAINASDLIGLHITLPSAVEQLAIASFLDQETARIDALIAKKQRQIELLQEKRTALISHAVTKGLDPNVKTKDSGIEWIGEMPEHWKIKKLKYLVKFVSGGTPSTANLEYWEGNIPWVSAKDMKVMKLIDTQDHISQKAVEEFATNLVPESTVLIVTRSGILQHSIPVGVAMKPMAINQDIKGLINRKKLLQSEYFAWFVEGHQAQLLTEWRKEGTTVESLEMELISNFMMIVPPLDEQSNIAKYLDHETVRIETLSDKISNSVQKLQEYRTALISAAVTGKIDVRGGE